MIKPAYQFDETEETDLGPMEVYTRAQLVRAVRWGVAIGYLAGVAAGFVFGWRFF